MSYTPFAVILAVLAVVVVVLFMYRRKLAASEDDVIHISDSEVSKMAHQSVLAAKLDKVDRVGKILTTIVVVGGAILFSLWVYFEQLSDSGARMG